LGGGLRRVGGVAIALDERGPPEGNVEGEQQDGGAKKAFRMLVVFYTQFAFFLLYFYTITTFPILNVFALD
jgi:hypothetical protein